jgi:hypothetical protein
LDDVDQMVQRVAGVFASHGPQGVEMACHVKEWQDFHFMVLEHLGLPDEWLESEDADKFLYVQRE